MNKLNRVVPFDDPQGPTTAALRRRLEDSGHLPKSGAASQQAPRHYICLLCGCNLGGDLHADRALGACGTCKSRPEARQLNASAPLGARGFNEANKSLIRKTHGLIPLQQLLGILNDRLKSDLGPNARPLTAEELHAEIAKVARPALGGPSDWAALRKLLADAKKTGTLARITEELVTDFAVVFQLTPNQVIRLKDVLLSREEDEP